MKFFFIAIIGFITVACANVKPYQKQYLNDKDMSFESSSIKQFETSFHGYREASSGANSGKTGGGCGCN